MKLKNMSKKQMSNEQKNALTYIQQHESTSVSYVKVGNSAKNYLIETWKQKLIKKFRDNHVWKYYTMAEILCELYDTDLKIKFIIDNMVQIDEKIPHSASKTNRKRKWLNSYIYIGPNGHF